MTPSSGWNDEIAATLHPNLFDLCSKSRSTRPNFTGIAQVKVQASPWRNHVAWKEDTREQQNTAAIQAAIRNALSSRRSTRFSRPVRHFRAGLFLVAAGSLHDHLDWRLNNAGSHERGSCAPQSRNKGLLNNHLLMRRYAGKNGVQDKPTDRSPLCLRRLANLLGIFIRAAYEERSSFVSH